MKVRGPWAVAAVPCLLLLHPASIAARHSLFPIQVAQALHITALVLDAVEGRRQLQGGGAHGLGQQKLLTLVLGRLLLSCQGLKALGCVLGRRPGYGDLWVGGFL